MGTQWVQTDGFAWAPGLAPPPRALIASGKGPTEKGKVETKSGGELGQVGTGATSPSLLGQAPGPQALPFLLKQGLPPLLWPRAALGHSGPLRHQLLKPPHKKHWP